MGKIMKGHGFTDSDAAWEIGFDLFTVHKDLKIVEMHLQEYGFIKPPKDPNYKPKDPNYKPKDSKPKESKNTEISSSVSSLFQNFAQQNISTSQNTSIPNPRKATQT